MATRSIRRVAGKTTATLGNDPFLAVSDGFVSSIVLPAQAAPALRPSAPTKKRESKLRVRPKPNGRTGSKASPIPVENLPPIDDRASQPTPNEHSEFTPGTDSFGLDATYAARLDPFLDFLFDRYFRCAVSGESNVPLSGGALLVGNHAGTLPYDGAMVMTAVQRATNGARRARPLGDDFVFQRPPVASWLSRIGVVRANPDNAHRLLTAGEIALVFPEGTRGLGKFFSERYRLTRFGRGGFVKVALRAGVPIIPFAVVGSEEAHPLLAQIPWVANLLGLPYFPVTPTFPWLGPLGLVPLPTKFFIRFGEPLALKDSAASIERSPDRLAELTEIVRTRVQAMVDELLAARRSIFFG